MSRGLGSVREDGGGLFSIVYVMLQVGAGSV